MTQNVVVRAYLQFEDKILLIKNIDKESREFNKFEMPGGIVEPGEELSIALSRHLLESIGRQFDEYNLFHAFSFNNTDAQYIVLLYHIKVSSDFKPKLSEQYGEYTWQKITKLDNKLYGLEMEYIKNTTMDKVEEKNTTSLTEGKLYTDGGSRGNPGPSALGYVIYNQDDSVVKKGSKYLGITTNNQAEYQAVKVGLSDCYDLGFSKVDVFLDSQLVANQMNGIYKIKNRDLWPIHEAIKNLALQFTGGVTFTYVPREYNKEADAMVNVELDEYESNKNRV